MGSNKQENRQQTIATWQGLLSNASTQAEQSRTQAQEDALRYQESILGTPQQMSYNAPAGYSNYSKQLTINPQLLDFYQRTAGTSEDIFGPTNNAAAAAGWQAFKDILTPEQMAQFPSGTGIGGYAQALSMAASNKMAQARDFFAAGKTDQANALQKEAQDMVNKYWVPVGGGTSAQMFSWTPSQSYAEDLAREQLSSPSAKTAGNLVQDAVSLSDPTSQGYQNTYRRLTSDAQNAIDTGERQAQRQLVEERRQAERDALRVGGGYGYRNLGSDSSAVASVGRDFAKQQADITDTASAARAQLFSDAGKWMEENTRQFAASQTEWAQKWLQNQAGFRDSFNTSMNNLAVASSEAASQMADRASKMWETYYASHEQNSKPKGSVFGSLLGFAGNILGTGLGIFASTYSPSDAGSTPTNAPATAAAPTG